MIRFYNGLTLEPTGVTNNEVWVDGSAISYVGPARADMPAFEREIDLNGDLLIPGFKNAHTHSAMTFLRSAADDLPLQDWLEKQVFPRLLRHVLLPRRLRPGGEGLGVPCHHVRVADLRGRPEAGL